jgi:chromosome segregation ATPase|nr:MAG TPA: Vacuolar sorting 38 and autophagy-related subunit 14 [Caudoviricetes sp.]
MRIEDMATWTVDQLKEELVRLADEREAKQHEILDKNEKINELQAELDNMCNYNAALKKQVDDLNSIPKFMTPDIDAPFEEIKSLKRTHQSDCITINQLQTALDVIIDRYANLRKIHGVS